MSAHSGFRDFAVLVADDYSDALRQHHVGELVSSCFGCHHIASSLFASAMRRWEFFVEEVLIDEMCGLQGASVVATAPRPKTLHPSRTTARRQLLRSRYNPQLGTVTLSANPSQYLLLHSPGKIVQVASHWVTNSQLSDAVSRRASDIERLMTLRHGASHGTRHAQARARATMLGYEPTRLFADIGAFLAASPIGGATIWLEHVLEELCDIALEVRR